MQQFRLWSLLSGIALFCACGIAALRPSVDAAQPETEALSERVPWTTSHVVGTPEPPAPYRTERIYPKLAFKQPVEMIPYPEGDWLCVVERAGQIRIFPDSQTTEKSESFLDGPKQVKGLKVTFGLAFHPKFSENRYCYVCYIRDPGPENGTRVSRFKVTDTDPPRIDAASETVLLEWLAGGHNGGSIKFGPDGYLYVSAGDGTAPSPPDGLKTGQDLSDLLASIMRIDVDRTDPGKTYAIPSDNPFVNTPGARGEVWAYGLRNPWRMSFDAKAGDLWVGDVGWQLWEMVYRIEKGGNYGWSIMEGPQEVRPQGKHGPSEILPPIKAHPRSDAASVTGGFVYHGQRLQELQGAYIYGDYVTGKMWGLRMNGDKIVWHKELTDTPHAIIVYFQNRDGELAYLDYNAGTIHQLVPNTETASNEMFPRRLSETGLFSSVKEHIPAPGVQTFEINTPQWMDHATAERFVAVPNLETITLKNPRNRVPMEWGNFPQNSVLVKTISLEMERGNPQSKRRLETQILHFHGDTWRGNSGEWYGYTYLWNDDQTDAELVSSKGTTLSLKVKDRHAPGGVRAQTWRVSSRAECYACHNPWAGYRLGFTVPQMNRTRAFGPTTENQLKRFENLGLIKLDMVKPNAKKDGVPKSISELPRFAHPDDQTAELERKARSYLHVNCAHCHRFGGGGTATILLMHDHPLAESELIGAKPTQGAFRMADAKLVTPGDPHKSVLYYRMAKQGRGRMPYLNSQYVDDQGVKLLRDWIAGLSTNGVPTRNLPNIQTRRALLQQLKLEKGKLNFNRTELVNSMLEDTSRALILMEFLTEEIDALAPEVKEQILTLCTAETGPEIRDLFERFLPPDQRSQRLGTVVDAEKLLTLPGDARRGADLFWNSTAMECKTCHQVGEKGGKVGPALTTIGKKLDRAALLESIIEPSKKIEPKYLAHLIETKQGKVHTGLLLESTENHVQLRTTKNTTLTIPRAEVESMHTQRRSLMPDLLHRDLTAQQLADLLSYLESLRGKKGAR